MATGAVVVIGKEPVTLSQLCLVATCTETRAFSPVELDAEALERVAKCAAAVASAGSAAAASDGAAASPPLPLSSAPTSSSSAAADAKVVEQRLRAALFFQVARAMHGLSGVRAETVEGIVAVLNDPEKLRAAVKAGASPAAAAQDAIVALGGLTPAEVGALTGAAAETASVVGTAALVLAAAAVAAGTVDALDRWLLEDLNK